MNQNETFRFSLRTTKLKHFNMMMSSLDQKSVITGKEDKSQKQTYLLFAPP